MKALKYLVLGIFFGFILTKSEVLSWYRIQEMFRFQSFHMYGIIGSAVVMGVIWVQLIKRLKLNDIKGNPIQLAPKAPQWRRYILGGIVFGLGWAMTGACPGPTFALVGFGYLPFIIVIFFGIVGTYLYGRLQKYLPH